MDQGPACSLKAIRLKTFYSKDVHIPADLSVPQDGDSLCQLQTFKTVAQPFKGSQIKQSSRDDVIRVFAPFGLLVPSAPVQRVDTVQPDQGTAATSGNAILEVRRYVAVGDQLQGADRHGPHCQVALKKGQKNGLTFKRAAVWTCKVSRRCAGHCCLFICI
jgi:hypothetical protein